MYSHLAILRQCIIEIAYHLKTNSFSRRGPLVEVYSDNGTNYRGAEVIIKAVCLGKKEAPVALGLTGTLIHHKLAKTRGMLGRMIHPIHLFAFKKPGCHWRNSPYPHGRSYEDPPWQAVPVQLQPEIWKILNPFYQSKPLLLWLNMDLHPGEPSNADIYWNKQ